MRFPKGRDLRAKPRGRSASSRWKIVRHALATKLALFYASYFAVIGIHLPFWPVWLEEARGLDPLSIGLVLAAITWPKVLTNIVIPRTADRLGRRRDAMLLLAAATLIVFALFGVAGGFPALLLLSAITGVTFAAILPLGEALALAEAKAAGIGYARVRLFGSIAFILATLACGLLLERIGASAVLVLILIAVALLLLACTALPQARPVAPAEAPRLVALWHHPGFVRFALAASLLHASHAVYYGFATIHWRGAGIGEATIGWLWAEGVIAEILLFLWAGGALERAGPRRVLLVAGILTAARWTASGLSADLPGLVMVQTLHGASFGAVHLATMHYLRDAVPAGLHGSAQGCYAALSALLFGLLMPVSGWLYGASDGHAFLAMAVVAIAAAGLVVTVARPAAAALEQEHGPE
jgi:MFS transporter, PPP family, 3-phenylpropionic acid transporter